MSWSNNSRPLVIGHRGASVQAVENTAEAFAAARVDGADGVELDVQQCATGELVVFHDETLDRLAGQPGRIDRFSLAQLRAVRLVGGARIPTLHEAFESVGSDMLVNVEIKASRLRISNGLVAAAVRATTRGLGERGLVSSFHPGALLMARRADPQAKIGMLFHGWQSVPLARAWPAMAIRPFSVHPHLGLVTARSVRRWHQRGYRVITWTADTYTQVALLARCGVDAIITNRPGDVCRYLDVAMRLR